jgi:formate dehydrogenase major subunit
LKVIRATINGQSDDFAEGISILEAAQSIGIDIPTLCHDPRLKPVGSCRMCLVQIEGHPHPLTSCNTALTEGMSISTRAPALEHERTMLLRMLAQGHPADVFKRFPDKQFHRHATRHGLSEADFDGQHRAELIDTSHPYIHVDMSQCILCYRCVRICEEVQGQFVWEVLNRGHETRIVPDSQTNLRESSCVSCGACVDTCPTGALEDNSILARGMPTDWTRTTCPYCGVGCELDVGTRNGQLVNIRPALDAPVNRGHLCVKGRYAFDFVSAKDRVTQPLIRDGAAWKSVSWEDAIAFVAQEFKRIIAAHGPDSIGILGSARGTNEEAYLTQKFARTVIGTNNVDCCARVCHAPTAAAMKMMLGAGAATNSYDDIESARTILVCGSNASENHPIVGARIKQAALKGANLIVIDPRAIELGQYAAIHLRPRPGANIPLLNAIACVIVEESLCDESFIRERVTEFIEFREFIKEFTPEKVADMCGVDAGLIREAARLYASGKPSMCFHGLGVTEHTQGTEGVMCLVNLALLTGNIGEPGTGINPLRGQNNVQGAAHMGCDPGILTGSIPINDARESFQRVWDATLPAQRGMNLPEMMEAAASGSLKALWAIGYDIFLTNPNANATEQALHSLELLIVQDLFMNETARFAKVFLPACSSFEKDGTFMNSERRIQRVRKVIAPTGQTKPDWEIICAVAEAMDRGKCFSYSSAEQIWNEVRQVWPAGRGITYDRLDRAGIQWPCWNENDAGTEILHRESFSHGKTTALRRIAYQPSAELTDAEFPFLLNTGRTLYQFNAGTMTRRTPNVDLLPTDYLDIGPEDAERLRVKNGNRVRVRSRYGEAALPVRIDSLVKPGQVFATFHDANIFLNRLTSPNHDRYVKTPEYKVTAVSISRV